MADSSKSTLVGVAPVRRAGVKLLEIMAGSEAPSMPRLPDAIERNRKFEERISEQLRKPDTLDEAIDLITNYLKFEIVIEIDTKRNAATSWLDCIPTNQVMPMSGSLSAADVKKAFMDWAPFRTRFPTNCVDISVTKDTCNLEQMDAKA